MQIGSRTMNLAGQRFGRWTVVEFRGVEKAHARWLCRCDCGTERLQQTRQLRSGDTNSCGCLHREVTTATHTRHGLHHSREYDIWVAMKQRCLNPGCEAFLSYGGRGITVCERWQNFANFYADMGPRPSPKYSLDRKDNNGNYEPDNCRWATKTEQQNNRRVNHVLALGDRSQTVEQWRRELGFGSNTIPARLRRGWSVERALTTPLASTNTSRQRLAKEAAAHA